MKTLLPKLKTLAVAGMTMGLALGAQADSSKVKIAQEVTLQPGWNAFSLNVSLEGTPDAVFSDWPVSKVGRYNQEAFFEEGQTLETMSTEDAYVMWRRGEPEQSPLKFISSGTYICFNTNAVGTAAFTTTLYGRPFAPAIKWHVCSKSDATNLWNLVGFSVEEDKDTKLTQYFDGFDGKTGWTTLKVGGDDPEKISWEKVNTATVLSNGMAIAMTSSKATSWSGVFGVKPSAGLDYIGTAATNLTLSITNAGTVVRTFKLTFGAGASQGSAPAPTLPTGLMLHDTSDSGNVWVEFSPTAPFTKQLNAGEKVDLEIAVDRTKLTGATGRYYAGVITVTDPKNASRMKASVPLEVSTLDPDYATDDGHDWLYNHKISGKEYAGEAAESSVDLFYVYPTLVGDEKIVIDGFRGIDDAMMRGDEVPSFATAAGAFYGNARCFADMTHVYAPYYRQATLATAMDCATNELGQIKATANADYLKVLYDGPAYADVTNALETYFMKWNKGRKFMLAGHSQGSAILRLVMEKYFMQDDMHKALLKNLVASYQIGYGVSKAKVDEITAATGVKFASTSNDVGVIVSYNLFGAGATGNSVLLPDDAMAINPLTWTTTTTPADKSLNLGAISQLTGESIGAGLYGATVNADRGTVECAEFSESAYVGKKVFGEKSLHGQDYPAFWENLRVNNYVRGGKLAGFCKLCTTNFPAHLCVSNAYYTTKGDLSTKNWVEPAGGTVWIPTNNLHKATVYLVPEKGYRLFNGDFEMPCVTASLKNYLKDGEYLIPDNLLSMLNFKWDQRAPNYADATGKDWLYNHNIESRKCPGEAADDEVVDLFYIYPTIAMTNADTTVNGYVSIDDPQVRGDEASKTGGAWSVFEEQGRVFADMTHVYAPFYRQASFVKAFEGSDQPKTWMDTFLKGLKDNQPYADIKAALDEYFTNLNPNGERPFILAGHSQGSSMLILVMENYFTGEKAKYLKNMVACYALGTGIGRSWMDRVTASTRSAEGLVDGITFATNATDVGVMISWNTEGPGADHSTACFPEDMIAINPLSWTTNTTPADKSLNLGAWTTNKSVRIIEPSLYGATVSDFGMVVCEEMPESQYAKVPNNLFGSKTLHGWDYKAYWANIRQDGWTRSVAALGLNVVTVTIPEVAGAKGELYYQGKPVASGKVPSNAVVRVVYTADDGYVFPDGKMTRTHEGICAWTDPTVAPVPEVRPVRDLRDYVIVDEYERNPLFEDWNPDDGTFVYDGVAYTNGVNAFRSFGDAFATESFHLATNILTFGYQTIATNVNFITDWRLTLKGYTTFSGADVVSIVSVGTTDAGAGMSGSLVDVTNRVAAIVGEGAFILSVTNGTPGAASYKADLEAIIGAAEIEVRYANFEPAREKETEPESGKEVTSETFVVDDQSKTEKDGTIVLPGADTDGRITVDISPTTTNDVVVAGKLQSREWDVVIVNETVQTLAVGAIETGMNVLITNMTDVGRIITLDNVVAGKNIAIDNNGHLDARVVAQDDITIRNAAINTLVGTYKAGGAINVSGECGSLSNAVIDAEGDLTVTGTNVITGPVDLKASGDLVFSGVTKTEWSVEGDNHEAMIDFTDVKDSTAFGIRVDAAQTDGDVVGVYTIASNATTAAGKSFALAGGSVSTTIAVAAANAAEVEAKTLYIGAKAYSLVVDANGALVFTVKYGKFAITYDAMGPYFTAGETTVVSDSYVHIGYSLPADPVREGYVFGGWYDGVTNGAPVAVSGSSLLYIREHTVFARWQANGSAPTAALSLAADGTVTPSGNVGNNLVLPDTIGGQPVLMIGKAAFAAANYKASSITNLVTGVFLRSIEPGAFNQVTTLKTLKITEARDFDNPSTVVPVTIGKRAFAGTRIESLEIAEGTIIGEQAFRGCSYLKEIAFFGDAANASLTAANVDAFTLCGYANGTGKIKLYMSDAFNAANAAFVTALKNSYAASNVEIEDIAGYSPATSVSISGLDVSQPTEMSLRVSADALIKGTFAYVSKIKILYRENLADAEREYDPTSVVQNPDGTYTLKFVAPNAGRNGFMRVEVR